MNEPRVTVCLLWHMHQPPYRVQGEDACFMPWVRLHAMHSYNDMVGVLEEFPDARVTINLTPTLVEQLRRYERGASDAFLDVGSIPAEELSEEQRQFLVSNFFSIDERRVIRAHPRYQQLLDKRNEAWAEHGRNHAARAFSTVDLRDLQVLFDLTWFGFKAREAHPELAEMLEMPGGFEQAHVDRIHEIEREVVGGVLDRYRRAARAGRIEISTSPYFHPILPLLVDSDSAREALPDEDLPPRLRAPEDARAQILSGLYLMEEVFGQRPAGLWPSEGSLSQRAAELIAESGLAWAASDAEVLARSERDGPASPFRPWSLGGSAQDLALVFRDRDLSDRVGFTYQTWHAHDAVADLLGHAVARARESDLTDPLVLIALDGENAWEHYPDAGSWFLRELYQTLRDRDDVVCEAVGPSIARRPERGTIGRLHAGSWIHANFSTWIGGPQKNRVWTRLGELREQIRAQLDAANASAELRGQVETCLYAAEASDWFWWLDDQYQSDYVAHFDRVQRAHLARAFALLDLPVPVALDAPLGGGTEEAETRVREVPGGIPATAGGRHASGDWQRALRLGWEELRASGAMRRASAPIGALWLGFSADARLLVRLEPADEPLLARLERVRLTVDVGADQQQLDLQIDDKGALVEARLRASTAGAPPRETRDVAIDVSSLVSGSIVVGVSRSALGLAPGTTARIRIDLHGLMGDQALRALFIRVPAQPEHSP